MNRAQRVFYNRVSSYFARLYGEELEAAPEVVRAILDEYYDTQMGERSTLDPRVTSLINEVGRQGEK